MAANAFDDAMGLLSEKDQPKPVGTSEDLRADQAIEVPKSAPVSSSIALGAGGSSPTPNMSQALKASSASDEPDGVDNETSPQEDAIAYSNVLKNQMEQAGAAAPEPAAAAQPTNYFEEALKQKASDSDQADTGRHPGSVNNPIKSSPLSPLESSALGLGNEQGNLQYLKSKYQDVAISPEHGVLIKQNNNWYEANLGYTDPWALTRDAVHALTSSPSIGNVFSAGGAIAKDVGGQAKELGTELFQHPIDKAAELASRYGPNVALSSAGAEAGMIAAAPLATAASVAFTPIAGAAVEGAAGLAGAFAGGSTAGAIRTSLGRMVGTYSASPQQQIADIGVEGMMGLGGQAIEIGAKPALSQFAKSMDFIKRNAVEPAKDVVADVMGAATSAGGSAMRTAMEAGGKVAMKMRTIGDEALALKNKFSGLGEGAVSDGIVSQEDVVNAAAQGKADAMKSILARATRKLPEKHEEIMSGLYEKADAAGMKAAPGDVLQALSDHLEENGLGKVSLNEETGAYEFKPFSAVERASRRNSGLPTVSSELPDSSVSTLNNIVTEVGTYRGIKSARGKAAAATMNDMNKSINSITDQFFNSKQPEFQSVTNAARVARDAIGQQYEEAGLGAEYGARRQLYNQFGDTVNTAKQVLNNEGAEALANKLSESKPGKNLQAKGLVGNLVQLGGEASQKDYENMMVYHAVQKLTPWRPSFGLVQLGATGTAIAKFGPAAIASHPIVAPIIASQFSPKIVGKEMMAASMASDAVSSVGKGTAAILHPAVQYAFATKDFIRSLSEPALKGLLNNPDALQAVLGTASVAPQQEEALKQQLLKQYGVTQ